MKIIARPRQRGKTQRLIELCAEADKEGKVAYIVCQSQQEAYRISKIAEELGFNIRFPITYGEAVQERLHGSFVNDLYIDNAEMYLQYVMRPFSIGAITLTTPDVND